MFVVTPDEMKNAEQASEAMGVSCAVLMDNVGRQMAEKISKDFGADNKSVAILCGTGNNGGDGFALAKNLVKLGAKCDVICVGQPKTDLAKACFDRCSPYFNSVCFADTGDMDGILSDLQKKYHIIVDCIFGTGFKGEIENENLCRIIDAVNNTLFAVKISADIPSGADAYSGATSKICFNADYTYALGALKAGHLKNPATQRCGELSVLDIGINECCYRKKEAWICDDSVFAFLPGRKRLSNKGSYGRLLNVAGSTRCIGAAWMSVNSALKTGVGLVRLCSVKDVTSSVATTLHECVFEPCGNGECLTADCAEYIAGFAANSSAVICGCGMGNNSDTAEIIKAVVNRTDCPVVIDADGISAISLHIDELKDNNRILFTPHPMEFSRLSGLSVKEILSDRIRCASSFAVKHGVNVLLKDAYSVFAGYDGYISVITAGNAGLAKAGSGDTLAGTVGGFLAQGLSVREAVQLSAQLFGLAAEKMAEDTDMSAIMPSAVPDYYSDILLKKRKLCFHD